MDQQKNGKGTGTDHCPLSDHLLGTQLARDWILAFVGRLECKTTVTLELGWVLSTQGPGLLEAYSTMPRWYSASEEKMVLNVTRASDAVGSSLPSGTS